MGSLELQPSLYCSQSFKTAHFPSINSSKLIIFLIAKAAIILGFYTRASGHPEVIPGFRDLGYPAFLRTLHSLQLKFCGLVIYHYECSIE